MTLQATTHQSPIRIKAAQSLKTRVPLATSWPPQKTLGTRLPPIQMHHRSVAAPLPKAPTLMWLTVEASCIISQHGWPTCSSNQTLMVLPTPGLALSKSAEASCKCTCLIKGHALAHHVIGRSGQLVRH